ncbi:MAG: DUF5343 domain-containing protein [Bacteroidales bacterium]|jgi:hypothetical protein
MAKELPPYVNATGTLKSVFEKIKDAATPPRFTQDYLVTKLGFSKSGSTLAIIPFLKKLGFIGSDGIPSDIYEKFRSPNEKNSGVAVAKAFKIGYAELYERNEYFHNLGKTELRNFLIEVTGADPKSRAITSLVNTIEILRSIAVFDSIEEPKEPSQRAENRKEIKTAPTQFNSKEKDMGFNISYTINLNLPETSDITVFDAIFKSLKEHILTNEKE